MSDEPTHPSENQNQEDDPSWDDETQAARLVDILDDYLAKLKQGDAPSRQELLAQHPELSDQLDACLSGIEFIHGEPAGSSQTRQLGEFRIIREVGRGGMGAVYEAEQPSLGRKVALKVLRFGSVSDPEAISRFKREAETVAALHHTNIVPIFSVGSESGVNYYAMQFIEGKSLDHVAHETVDPIEAIQVARWGLEASEALNHAHQRGVIHRDVKPSNLILDQEGRIWLTDFGLAKRSDDITLSMTGALLGTPRYMSPEQAATRNHVIDHRTDIYSLGATLYELLTGQPVFQADSPLEVIAQIISDDPAPPRKINPSVPKDLETIVLKCLAKESSRRYQSSQALAADLRAVVEDRPIVARRANWLEQSARWFKRRRRSVRLAVSSAGLTLMVIALIVFGSLYLRQSRTASLRLRTDSQQLVAQVWNDKGEPVSGFMSLPNREPVQVTAGSRRIHVQGNGYLSQFFDVQLEGAALNEFDVTLEDRLYDESQIPLGMRVVQFGDRAEIVSLMDEAIVIESPGERIHHRVFRFASHGDPNLFASSPGLVWPWHKGRPLTHSGYGPFDLRPFVVGQIEPSSRTEPTNSNKTAPDVDQDGTPDLIVAARHQAWIIAISGRDGAPIWFAARSKELSQPDEQQSSRPIQSGILYEPSVVRDLDGDQIPELLVMVGNVGSEQTQANQIWLEAISGADGHTIWKYEFDPTLLQVPNGVVIPEALRWYVGTGAGSSMRGGYRSSNGLYTRRDQAGHATRRGTALLCPTMPIIETAISPNQKASVRRSDAGLDVGDRDAAELVTTIHLFAGEHFISIDLQDGSLANPIERTGYLPELQPAWHDIDGDGSRDAVIVRGIPGRTPNGPFGPTPDQLEIAIWDPSQKQIRWSNQIKVSLPIQSQLFAPKPAWPKFADVNQDGTCDVVVPGTHNRSPGVGMLDGEAPWGELTVLNGQNGKLIWSQRVFSLDTQVDYFEIGPDITGDQKPEIFVASLWGDEPVLFVEALDGVDGHQLWWTKQTIRFDEPSDDNYWLSNPSIWKTGDLDWPSLAIPVYGESSRVYFFSTGTGELRNVLPETHAVWFADVDGDSSDDLISYRPTDPGRESFDTGGRVSTYLGHAAESWRRVGKPGHPFADLDLDGIVDLIQIDGPSITAKSGRDGQTMWQISRPRMRESQQLLPIHLVGRNRESYDAVTSPDAFDIDGDSVPDLTVAVKMVSNVPQSCLLAISGRTGRLLWELPDTTIVAESWLALKSLDLDSDQRAEVVYVVAIDESTDPHNQSVNGQAIQIVMGCVDDDGEVLWRYNLSQDYSDSESPNSPYYLHDSSLPITFAHLNRDDVLDVLVLGEDDSNASNANVDNAAYHAIDGADGGRIWIQSQDIPGSENKFFNNQPPILVTDINEDGVQEVITCVAHPATSSTSEHEGVLSIQVRKRQGGHLEWAWSTGVSGQWLRHQYVDATRNQIGAALIRRGEESNLIGLLYANSDNENQLTLLDTSGELVKHQPIPAPPGSDPHREDLRIWVCDIDDDDRDEVICAVAGSWTCFDPMQIESPIWQRPIVGGLAEDFLALIQEGDLPPQLLLRTGPTTAHYQSINAATGETIWSSTAPAIGDGYGIQRLQMYPMSSLDVAAPILFFTNEQVSVCRQANPVMPIDRVAKDDLKLQSVSIRESATLRPGRTDPRRVRRLPWVPSTTDGELRSGGAFWGFGGLLGTFLFVLPVGYLFFTVRRAQWSLAAWLGLAVIIAIWLAFAFVIPVEHEKIDSVWARMLLGLVCLPVIVWLIVTIGAALVGRWKFSLQWTVLTLLISLGIAVVGLALRGGYFDRPLNVGEVYGFEHWYFLFVWSTYVTGSVAIVTFPFLAGMRMLHAGRHGAMARLQKSLGDMEMAETEVNQTRDKS